MTRPTWDDTRIAMARALGRRSLCERDQVGALIIDVDGKVIGEGYNGPPRHFEHRDVGCSNWCPRASRERVASGTPLDPDYLDCPALHAEANALLMSDRSLRVGGALYVTSHVCHQCAKLVANSGLSYVFVDTVNDSVHRRSDVAYRFLADCGVVTFINGTVAAV